jgi:hypothetical protein
MSGYPDDRYDDRRDPPDGEGAVDIEAGKARVKTPAIVLLILSVITLLLVPLGVIQYFMLPKMMEQQREQVEQNKDMPADQKKKMKEFLDTYEEILKTALPISLGIQTVIGVLATIGSVKMIKLSSRGWATTAAALNLLPIGTFCCCITLPVGIWALVVLGKPDVKAAFAAAKSAPPGGD